VASRWTLPIALAADHSPPSTTTTTSTTTTPVVAATPTAAIRQTPPTSEPTTTTSTTTTTAPPPLSAADGVASWYPEAPPGYCASPYLRFGSLVTVTDVATGRSIRCIVDDRQAINPGRVIDLSYDGFSDLTRPSIGLVEVRLSW
jgi:rare lipoprotein A (peptidoglycan hydrolase)